MTTSRLTSLPLPLLKRIIDLVLATSSSGDHDASLTLPFLHELGKTLSRATEQVLFQTLILEDDDALLVEVEEAASEGTTTRTKLGRVWGNPSVAMYVRELRVVAPRGYARRDGGGGGDTQFAVEGLQEHELDQHASGNQWSVNEDTVTLPLEDTSFLLLLSKLSSLTRFHWSTGRLPPPALCQALGVSTRSLLSFELDIGATSPESDFHSLHPGNGTSTTGLGGALSRHRISPSTIRWDATGISSLPVSLVHLSVSQLSQTGSRALSAAFASLPLLEILEISRTVYVDDALLESISENARRLKKLVVREMGGTKLTEKGLRDLFEGVDLEVLEFESVEGRLARMCWKTLTLPDSLHTIKISYGERGPYKSWIFDHFASLPFLFASPFLTSLSISRRPPPQALVPGQHHISLNPIYEGVHPRVLGSDLFDVIVKEGEKWRELDLDFFLVGLEHLKKIMDKCPNLLKLCVMLDGPFKGLLTLGSSFALTHDLRRFQVSIDPKHTPELFMRESSTYHHYSLPLSPSPSSRTTSLPAENLATSAPLSPPLTASRSPSTSGRSPASPTTTSNSVVDSLPTTREWRRFTKKAMRLHSIEWGGRGGMGVWTFEKGGGTKVDFEPVCQGGVPHKILERRESDESNFLKGEGQMEGRRLSSGQIGTSGSWGRRKARRMSEVSLKGSCLEGLDFEGLGLNRNESHAKEGLGVGLGLKGAHQEGNGNGGSAHGGNGNGRRHSSAGTSSSTTTSPCTSPKISTRSLHHKQSSPVVTQPQAIPSSKFSATRSSGAPSATSPPSLGPNSPKSFVSVAAASPENWQVPLVLHSTSPSPPPTTTSWMGTKGTPFVVGVTTHNPTLTATTGSVGATMTRGSSSGSQSTSVAERNEEVGAGEEEFTPVQGRKVIGKKVSGKFAGGKK